MTTSKLSLLKTDMDLKTAKNAVRSARIAWHATIGIGVNNEFEAIQKLERVIEALQVWLPNYDPRPQTRMQPIRSG